MPEVCKANGDPALLGQGAQEARQEGLGGPASDDQSLPTTQQDMGFEQS